MDVVAEHPTAPPGPARPGLRSALLSVVRGPNALRRWAVVSLVMNIAIVVTGGLVRLTRSGLGCPTWPRCTDDAFVPHPALGIHGAIEFGNRLLTFVLIIGAVLTLISAFLYRDQGRPRHDLRAVAFLLAFGIPFQGVIGGITVLTQLNPYVVALHFLLSMVLIVLAVWLVRRTRSLAPREVRPLGLIAGRTAFVAMWVAVWLGTVVTGSGPHAGDAESPRTGLNTLIVAHVHADAAYLAIAAAIVCLAVTRSRAALLLVAAQLLQAGVGLAQWHLGLPIGLVTLHMLGACLGLAAAANLSFSLSRR